MEFFNNKKSYIIIVIASVIVLGTIGAYVYKSHNTNETGLEEQLEENEDEIKEEILVHVAGEVNKPGIVVLEEGDRIIDAIEEAGGATQNANLNSLNLAQSISDGEKIYVPNKDENNIETNNNNNNQINVNTATEQELSQLDGIGSSIAKKIIEYRKENKKFNDIEELKNIQGIGEAKFEGIKNKITIK